MSREPTTSLDGRFSSPGAAPTPWSIGEVTLELAEIYWISTVRPDGQPHVTPMIAIWLDNALHFTTGPYERKAKYLAQNPRCTITTGCNKYGEGLDVMIEGQAAEITDLSQLQRLADAYQAKYGWQFAVRDGVFVNDQGDPALAFAVQPRNVFGFGRGETFSQTRWHFGYPKGNH